MSFLEPITVAAGFSSSSTKRNKRGTQNETFYVGILYIPFLFFLNIFFFSQTFWWFSLMIWEHLRFSFFEPMAAR